MVTTSAATLALDPYNRDCPSRQLLDRIGDRWTVLIVGALGEGAQGEGTLRFSELGRRVQGISQKMLTQTLRELERDGLVARTVHAEVPPRVEYRLTGEGRSLHAVLVTLESWAIEHFDAVAVSRSRYDARR